MQFEFCGNHTNAVKGVVAGTAQLAFVFNETWNGLNASTRAGLEVLAATMAGSAFHCFMVGPEWADKAGTVQAVLVGMQDDPAGKSILDELGFQGLEAVDASILEGIKGLIAE
ncbi:PhnD/SsuA/transferrin family substrate-binding protein [Chitiniphilus shinanonensis]|uniref:PhnD/SsuA/transferrin family substrate-binding protein n=1 Tax=Chitiniphilus shinanonensis TaxID=553088 RepID=UPI00304C7FFA